MKNFYCGSDFDALFRLWKNNLAIKTKQLFLFWPTKALVPC